MINDIRFKIIAGKFNKISKIIHDFCPKNARLHNNKTTRSRPGRGQMFEAEAEPNVCPRNLTSLEQTQGPGHNRLPSHIYSHGCRDVNKTSTFKTKTKTKTKTPDLKTWTKTAHRTK